MCLWKQVTVGFLGAVATSKSHVVSVPWCCFAVSENNSATDQEKPSLKSVALIQMLFYSWYFSPHRSHPSILKPLYSTSSNKHHGRICKGAVGWTAKQRDSISAQERRRAGQKPVLLARLCGELVQVLGRLYGVLGLHCPFGVLRCGMTLQMFVCKCRPHRRDIYRTARPGLSAAREGKRFPA